MKNTRKGIRSIISLQKTSNDSPKIISLEDHTVTDPRTIANTFNNSFCSVATRVQSEVQSLVYGFLKWKMIRGNGFSAISCFIFVSPKIGGCIYTNFPVLLE